MRLVTYPNKSLATRSTNVKKFGKALARTLESMKKVMLKEGGIGLAANQVGLTKRMFIAFDNNSFVGTNIPQGKKDSADIQEEDNSEQEICDVTQEMIERLEGTFKQDKEDRIRVEKYFDLFPADHWAAGVKTPIGRDFLRNNWHLFQTQPQEHYSPKQMRAQHA